MKPSGQPLCSQETTLFPFIGHISSATLMSATQLRIQFLEMHCLTGLLAILPPKLRALWVHWMNAQCRCLEMGGDGSEAFFRQSGDHKHWLRIKWLFAIPVYCRGHGKVLLCSQWAHRLMAIIITF